MVPDAYHPFFSGCASVAGALIGLLFVAISVAPHKMAGERAEVTFQVGAGAAFAALLNTLVLSLSALLPGTNLASVTLLLGTIGVSSTAILLVLTIRDRGVRQNLPGLIRLGALLIVFVVQIANATHSLHGHDNGEIHLQADLCLILFVIAINQAWKLLDANGTRLFPVLFRLLQRSRPIEPKRVQKSPKSEPLAKVDPFSSHSGHL
jgi:hypothetical protein